MSTAAEQMTHPSSATAHISMGAAGHEQEEQQHHHRYWFHPREKEDHRKKQINAQLPSVLAGAKDVHQAERRLRFKNEVIAALGEFVGTFLFLFFAEGIATVAQRPTAVNPNSAELGLDPSQLLYISLGFGFSLAVNAWLFFRVSGGLFNPAVALGLLLTGNLTLVRFPILVIMEFAGGIAAAGMVALLLPGGINASVRLGDGVKDVQGWWIEFLMSGMLQLKNCLPEEWRTDAFRRF